MSGTLDAEAEHRRKMNDYEQRKKDYEQRKKDYEQRKKDDERENEKLVEMILQTKNDAKQIENENARLAELESKIDGLFSKYNINSPLRKTPDQP